MKPTPSPVERLRRQLAAERRRTDALLEQLAADVPANDPTSPRPSSRTPVMIPSHDVAEVYARKVARQHGWSLPKKAARR